MQALQKLTPKLNLLKFNFSTLKTASPHLINVEDAKQFTNDSQVKFLDIRDIEEYKKDHIDAHTYSGDKFFWFRSGSDPQEIKKLQDTFQEYLVDMGVNKDDYLIPYEQQLSFRKGASCRAYYLLKLLGHKHVSILNGGYDKWLQENQPVTSEVRKVQAKGNFEAGWNKDIWASQVDVLETLKKKDRVFIDVRDEDEWKGESSSPLGKDFNTRKGRIEGARWLFWEKLMKQNNGVAEFNSPEEIRKQMEEIGVKDLNQPITVYCFKGARASNTLIALQTAGFKNVNNYFASWNEWSEDHSLPIDDRVL
ncbi:Rhodanese-like domain [Pseudocohnilembus persalinus]|uniref:Rhodanese-like domain n=1 Tax=Pseudocohnilembus persalinus TaxID=266149 RepID=A0A0V0Q9G3_PSEPJ|nr:Rhodanese-like domain [Pseudocohnilembus persalinus]|eukprot:KRW98862.1 Rhodanese-like domain [Pseudocohnilembus persalinus]